MNNEYWDFQQPPILVGVISNASVTTALCFDGLAGLDRRITFRLIDPYARDASAMDACDLIVLVRHLFMPVYKEAFEQAKRRGKPVYLLIDDNFVVLAGEKQPNPADDEIFKPYTQPIFKETLQDVAGILSASPALTEFFRSYHATILPFSAVIDWAITPKRTHATGDDLRVGFFGGGFRTQALVREVLPALKAIAETRPVTLFAGTWVETVRAQIEECGMRLVAVPLISNFRAFVRKWQTFGIQVAVHPKGETANIKYKTANAVLVSHYLGAVPIISDEPAYKGIGIAEGAFRIGADAPDYLTAFNMIEGQRDALLDRLAGFCEKAFDPRVNIDSIRKLGRHEPTQIAQREAAR